MNLIEAIKADREAGTPGPWSMETKRTSCGVCHQVGPWPHKWRAGDSMSACIYDDYPSPAEGTDAMLSNARRIARVPDMEAALLAAAELAVVAERAIKLSQQMGDFKLYAMEPMHRALAAYRAAVGPKP